MDEVNSDVIIDIDEMVLDLEPGTGFKVTVDGQLDPASLRYVIEAVGRALGVTSGRTLSTPGEPGPMGSTP